MTLARSVSRWLCPAIAAASLVGATVTLASASTPNASPATATSHSDVRFDAQHAARIGGPARAATAAAKGFNINGYNWSGLAATGSGFTSVTSSWTEPTVTCNSTNDLMAPWVGIDGYGSSTVEQTGVETDCSSGHPIYSGWYEMYPANPVYYTNAVAAGDHINATVSRSGSTYTLTLNDSTKGWTKTTVKSANDANSSAEVIIESPTGAYPRFGTVSFSNTKVNGSAIANYSPVAMDASNSGGYEDRTSAISGGTSFSISYLRE